MYCLVDQFGLFFIERGPAGYADRIVSLPRRGTPENLTNQRMGMKDHAGVIGVAAGPGGNQACQVAV